MSYNHVGREGGSHLGREKDGTEVAGKNMRDVLMGSPRCLDRVQHGDDRAKGGG